MTPSAQVLPWLALWRSHQQEAQTELQVDALPSTESVLNRHANCRVGDGPAFLPLCDFDVARASAAAHRWHLEQQGLSSQCKL